jgi:hypothetical protein
VEERLTPHRNKLILIQTEANTKVLGMNAHAVAIVRVRAALVWVVVTAADAALVVLAAPLAHRRPGTASFDDLLVGCCAVVALIAATLLWLVTTEVTLGAWRRPERRRAPAGRLRTALLAACGVAALSTTTPAALATPPDGPEPPSSADVRQLLDGLPLPDRADGAAPAPRASNAVVRAEPGDSLWSIAADALGARASEEELAAYWHRVVTLNTDTSTAGPDLVQPDLIHPGQQVRLPPH